MLLLLAPCYAESQWSTSTKAESALYVCPGFEPGLITYSDGSSLVLGALSGSIYARKLDQFGNYLWPQPVKIFQASGATSVGDLPFESGSWYCSDGDGGAIVFWYDYAGAYVGPDDYYNNAVYMQRVDRNGNLLWRTNGIQVASIDGGNKKIRIVDDGNGGAIVNLTESDFRRPGAIKKERMWIKRYNNNAMQLWSYQIDSSTIEYNIYPPSEVIRLDSIIRLNTSNGFRFVRSSGGFVDTMSYMPFGSIYVVSNTSVFEFTPLTGENDSLGNSYIRTRITSLSNNFDSLWSFDYKRLYEPAEQFGKVENSVLSNGAGGLYLSNNFTSQSGEIVSYIQSISPSGTQWSQNGNNGLRFTQIPIQSLFAGKNEVGAYFGNGTARKFDTAGNNLWNNNFIVLADGANAYFKRFASDNNGGGIIAY